MTRRPPPPWEFLAPARARALLHTKAEECHPTRPRRASCSVPAPPTRQKPRSWGRVTHRMGQGQATQHESPSFVWETFRFQKRGVNDCKRGPISRSKYGQKPGPKPDPERQQRLRNPATKATKATKLVPKPPTAIKSATPGPPPVPEHLGVVGTAIWDDIWRWLPILSPALDGHSVQRYCEAADDASRARAEIAGRGLVIDEVILDPRGGPGGTRAVLNPAEAALRRADKVLDGLGDRLGLSPASRARLGLVISQTELASAEANRILSGMFVPYIDEEQP